MMTTFAKIFIIMTILFEVITLTSGAALYPVFFAASAILFICIAIQYIVPRIARRIVKMLRRRNVSFG